MLKTEPNSGLSQLASELPFSFHLAAKGKCPPEGLQAQNTANWLTSEPTCLPAHMFLARIKGLPIFSRKIIIESFGLFDYHYFFVKMHVRALGQAAGATKLLTVEKHILQARCVQYCNTAPFHFGQTAILSVLQYTMYVPQVSIFFENSLKYYFWCSLFFTK